MSDKNKSVPMRYSEGIEDETLRAEDERQFFRRGLGRETDSYFADRLRRFGTSEDFDTEEIHSKADEILCELLESLGYLKTVRAFRELPKWYS